MSFPRYPKYKDSDVEWLREVPEHWKTWKLSKAFDSIGSGTTPKTDNLEYYVDGTIPWVNTGDLNDGEISDCDKRISKQALEQHSSLKLYPSGSLLIAMYGATIGKLAINQFECSVNQACCVFSGQSTLLSKFMFFWFIAFRQQIISLATGGGQPNISQEILRSLRLCVPNLIEQNHIVAFLARETAKIDELVAQQERLIELLKEKRQAVISHAVTKGLNPNAPMKPSGIEWLGDIPSHWKISRLKHVAKKVTDGEHISPATVEEGIPLLSAKDVRDRKLDYDVDKYVSTEDAHLFWRRCRPELGDVLIVSRGATIGRIAVVDHEKPFCLMGSVILCKPNHGYQGEFLYFALNAKHAQTAFLFTSAASAQQAIYIEDVAEVLIPLPPRQEREEILKFLDGELLNIESLIVKAQHAIDLLKERRTALISAAVTGQIDVRSIVEIPEPLSA